MSYLEERRNLKLFGRKPEPKKVYRIPKKSEKKKIQEAKEKEIIGEGKTEKEKWFLEIREKLVGTCQCGCGGKSQKNDDTYFRSSCCHIFPKNIFKSIALHPDNYVERAFFGGCHGNMDDRSMDLWINFADWDEIVEKFYILEPLLTENERTKKFYTKLKTLITHNHKP
jgi:hypothetical protein